MSSCFESAFHKKVSGHQLTFNWDQLFSCEAIMVWSNVLRDWFGTVSIIDSLASKRIIRRLINWEDFNVVMSRVGSDSETHNFGSAPSDVRLHA
jgi:hypothetical protein